MSLRLPARLSAAAAIVAVATGAWSAVPADGPVTRPAGRLQAVAVLSGGSGTQVPCLAPIVAGLRQDPSRAGFPLRRAVSALYADPVLAGERRSQDADGTVVRWSADRTSLDRLDGSDADADGLPDAAEAALAGVAAARRLLSHRDFPSADPVDVVLARLGSGVDGVALPGAGRDGRTVLLVEGAARGGAAAVRRAAAHQYAHAVGAALGQGLPAAWGEALATWVSLSLDADDDRALAAVGRRLERLADGLGADDLDLAAGNAAWLTFLDASYGPTALRLSFDELARGGSPASAMDRALRRAVGVGFADAFRDFQLWSVLVGARADGRHFPFASRLASPEFASSAEGLPAVSVLQDPAVAPAGAAAVRLAPGEIRGGMSVRFEGEVGARWDVDLLLLREGRAPHRLALAMTTPGKGEVTVPLDGLQEALLLVRNVDPEDHGPRRFTWSAFRDAAYPYEIGSLSATPDGAGSGVLVGWETLSETGVLGFNVLRTREDGGATVRLNPVWVPAVGDRATAAAYQFVDLSAETGVAYEYRIEGVTPDGLSSLSEPVELAVP